MISTLKEIGFWRRLFQWKAVCSEIGAEFASIKADLDTANLQLHAYEQRLSASKAELDQHKSHLHEANSELAHHRVKERRTREGHRTLLHFIAQAHGLKVKVVVAFGILFACCSWGAFPPPFVHNPLDTNTLGLAPSTSYFLGWNGTKPAWGVPPDGLGTNSWLTNTSFIFPIPHLAASNDLGWWNSGGDVSFNATNNDKLFGLNATNQSTVVSNGLAPRMFFTLQSYMILGSTVSANQTNFFAIHGTTTKSTTETSTKELFLVNGVNGHGAWVSNFWMYFNSSIGTSTNLFFYLITNGVATTCGFNFTGNSSANRYVNDAAHPFFIGDGYDWSIAMTNNNNLPASLVFSWGIIVYPQ